MTPDYAATLTWQLKMLGITGVEREVKFHQTRRWKVDLVVSPKPPRAKIAVEIEGGIWKKSRHTTGKGFTEDCVKYNELTLAGYKLLRVTPQQVTSGEAVQWIERAIGAKQA